MKHLTVDEALDAAYLVVAAYVRRSKPGGLDFTLASSTLPSAWPHYELSRWRWAAHRLLAETIAELPRLEDGPQDEIVVRLPIGAHRLLGDPLSDKEDSPSLADALRESVQDGDSLRCWELLSELRRRLAQ